MCIPSATPKKVIIIGAGAAGLQAALTLHKSLQKAVDIEIFEASGDFGGRVRTDSKFADFPIELGGEEIAGEHSLHHKYAKKLGIELIDEGELKLYVEEDGHFQRLDDIHSDEVKKAIDLTELIGKYDSLEDISVIDYLKRHGFSDQVRFIFENIWGREWGANLERLSMKSLQRYAKKNTLGEHTFFLTQSSQKELLGRKFKSVLGFVKYNRVVKKVDYSSGDKITIYDSNWNTYTCDYVIVCVPLSILKGDFIEFTPSLPADKQAALQVLSMDAGAKVIMSFSEPFWPKDLKNTIEDDIFNYVWSASNVREDTKSHTLTALVTGKHAISLTLMSQEDIKEKAFKIFSKFGKTSKEIKDLLLNFKVQNWLLEPFIKGAYSYPAFGLEGSKFREIMMQPVESRIFFAGEAFNKENFSTIGSALQSGMKAASQLKRVCEHSQPSNEQTAEMEARVIGGTRKEKVGLAFDYKTLRALEHLCYNMQETWKV